MTRNSTILNELKELNSKLADAPVSNIYAVPDGYFSALVSNVISRIKTMQAADVSEEVQLPPVFENISKEMPYSVPDEYFEKLQENILKAIHSNNGLETAEEELAALSPLLSGLKKKIPYTVPQGYFENLSLKENKQKAKVISLAHRRMFRYIAAAVVTGIIVLAGLLVFNNKGTTAEPGSKALAKFTTDVKKMDDTQKDNLIDFIDAGLTGDESAGINPKNQKEIKELLKNIPEQELLDFQKQSEDIEPVLFTN